MSTGSQKDGAAACQGFSFLILFQVLLTLGTARVSRGQYLEWLHSDLLNNLGASHVVIMQVGEGLGSGRDSIVLFEIIQTSLSELGM
jgi:hypothetical protein